MLPLVELGGRERRLTEEVASISGDKDGLPAIAYFSDLERGAADDCSYRRPLPQTALRHLSNALRNTQFAFD